MRCTTFQRSLFCALGIFSLAACYNFTKETVPGSYPVADVKLTRSNGELFEVWVHVERGVRLDSLVDVSYFDSLDHRMSLDAAKRRFGEPRSIRIQPDMRLPVSLYPVPKGEVGFMEVPTSGGAPRQPQVWAYPSNQSPGAVILDASLRAQVLRHLPADRATRVHILRDVGHGGLTLSMSSNQVDYLILGPRDGE